MHYFSSLVVFLLLMASPAIAREQAPEAKEHTRPDVSQALTEWVTAIEGQSAENIIKLYDKNAVMISTFAQAPITTHKGLLAYYKKVVANPDAEVDVTETHPRVFGNMAVNSGQYVFHYTQDGESVTIPARFSFTYILRDSRWIIVDHHSSRVPLPDEMR
jgi:uncharacterized protein (TIGR02246 family)